MESSAVTVYHMVVVPKLGLRARLPGPNLPYGTMPEPFALLWEPALNWKAFFWSTCAKKMHGMEWNRNFDMKYGRCQNGMEDFKNGIE